MKHIITTAAIMICLHGFAQQKIYVSTYYTQLYSINLTDCSYQYIGTSAYFSDIAVTADGRLWGLDGSALYQIDTLTAASTLMDTMWGAGNAMVELDDSTLLIAGGTQLYKVNVNTGEESFIGGTGYSSAGDLTWYDNYLYLIGGDTAGVRLIKIQLNSTNTAIVSSTPVSNTPIPGCYGAITAPFAGVPNLIVGFNGIDVYTICPFDATYKLLCPSIFPSISYEIQGAASVRLPIQSPLPGECILITSSNESLQYNFEINSNPVIDKFEIPNTNSKIRCVEVYGVRGEKVFQSDLIPSTSTLSVDVSFLNSEIFFVTVTDVNGNRVTKKLIKI